MNKNAIPTVIRGTTIKPGDRVFRIANQVRASHDVFGLNARPCIEAITVIATNGVTFAFKRGQFGNPNGAYRYVGGRESSAGAEGYLVNDAEAKSALADALHERLPYAMDELVETEARIAALTERAARLRDRIATLEREEAATAIAELVPASSLGESVHA